MKKNICGWILFTVLFCCACEHEMMSYEGEEGVYFAVQRGDYWESEKYWPYQPDSYVEFIKQTGDSNVVLIKVMITGEIKNYDRKFGVTVLPDSTTAIENIHYLPLVNEVVVPAGSYSVGIPVTLLRAEDLKKKERRICLQLVESDDFTIVFPEWHALPGVTGGIVPADFDAGKHMIYVNDFMVQPDIWMGEVDPETGKEGGMWGAFSEKKLNMMCERFQLTYSDFMSLQTMPEALQRLITATMADMLIEASFGDPVLEEDGRMMWVEGCFWDSYVAE